MTSHDASRLKITAVHEVCEGGRQTPKGLIMLNIVASICVNVLQIALQEGHDK